VYTVYAWEIKCICWPIIFQLLQTNILCKRTYPIFFLIILKDHVEEGRNWNWRHVLETFLLFRVVQLCQSLDVLINKISDRQCPGPMSKKGTLINIWRHLLMLSSEKFQVLLKELLWEAFSPIQSPPVEINFSQFFFVFQRYDSKQWLGKYTLI
jgi:hypothetical protein